MAKGLSAYWDRWLFDEAGGGEEYRGAVSVPTGIAGSSIENGEVEMSINEGLSAYWDRWLFD